MKFEELTNEQLEEAKKCETYEERMNFLEKYGIDIPLDQMDNISGGAGRGSRPQKCPKGGYHTYEFTGNTRPGEIWGDLWPFRERRCTKCGDTYWF